MQELSQEMDKEYQEILDNRKKYTFYIKKFIEFVKDQLTIKSPLQVTLTSNKENIKTTALFNTEDNSIIIYTKFRALVDILRSLAHEMQHLAQKENNRLNNVNADGADGSDIENEANAVAGKMIRLFGKKYPEIYVL